jgi:hypothetical protein
MGAYDGLDNLWRFPGDGRETGITNGEDSDGVAAVDLVNKLGFGKVFVEGGKIGILT